MRGVAMDSISMADGRTVAFADLGEPGDPAVFFAHGFMACRLTGRPAPGVRVVTLDRPGVGRSSLQRGRTALQWCEDVASVADTLGIARFAVLGHSGGSPYAAACAFRLRDRVTSLGIASGFTPFDGPDATDGMNARMARSLAGLRRAPWVARLATSSLPRQYQRDPDRAFDKQFGADLGDNDRRLLADADTRRAVVDAAVESTRQGAGGLAVEMQLLFCRPWGFALSDVDVRTSLWYGEEDGMTPPAAGERLAKAIPGASLTIYPHEGHMAVFTHWEEIVTSLVA